MKLWKKIVLCLLCSTGVVVAYSLIYNYPIRFYPKWSYTPNSITVLHPAGRKPDNIVLTPSRDIATMATITWRTDDSISDGVVEFEAVGGNGTVRETASSANRVVADELTSNHVINCHTATLTGLTPKTTYRYRVGNRTSGDWSGYRTFITGSGDDSSFSFVYFGDTQIRPDRFGKLLRTVESRHPDIAFYMIGGDLVDMGDLRNLWDDFLANTTDVFSQKFLAPVMGNHDFGDKMRGSRIFNTYFHLPGQPQESLHKAFNYSFRCGPAYFIALSQCEAEEQRPWLEEELQMADSLGCAFKVVMFHYPIYNAKKNRDNPEMQKHWVPLFDKYGVDLVLTGHDHSYMRSKELKAGVPVSGDERGTVYVVANACDKHNKFVAQDIAEKQFTDVATYQLITVAVDPGRHPALHYQSRDGKGTILDEFKLLAD